MSMQAQLAEHRDKMMGLADLALKEARARGADEAKVAASTSFQKRLVVENKTFSLANSLQSQKLGISVHKDKKKGTATINVAREEAVQHAVGEALALASFSVPDENLVMAAADEARVASGLPFLFDRDLAETPMATIKDVMQDVLAELTKDKRVALDRFEMAIDVTWHCLCNSLGVRQAESQTMAHWTLFGMGVDGEQVGSFDYVSGFSFDLEQVARKAKVDGQDFVRKVLGNLHPKIAPSYRGLVLLSPRAVRSILLGVIQYHAGGRQIMDGKSRWAEKLGERVASPQLTIDDLPLDPRFSGATSYDGDGLPTRNRSLIARGELQEFLLDCYSAKKLGRKPNGAAGAPFAVNVSPGDDQLTSLLAARDKLLVVDRFSGNTDPVKGDFSGVAKSSHLYDKGQDQGSVTETMIAGNVFDLLGNIQGISQEVEMDGGSFLAPYILVDGVSVTGQG